MSLVYTTSEPRYLINVCKPVNISHTLYDLQPYASIDSERYLYYTIVGQCSMHTFVFVCVCAELSGVYY